MKINGHEDYGTEDQVSQIRDLLRETRQLISDRAVHGSHDGFERRVEQILSELLDAKLALGSGSHKSLQPAGESDLAIYEQMADNYRKGSRASVDEQVLEDAKRYRWLFGARTHEECSDEDVGLKPPKAQDRVISAVAITYLDKDSVDRLIDREMNAPQVSAGPSFS